MYYNYYSVLVKEFHCICNNITSDVVEGMTQVANYINETQRVSEVYSCLFDTILAENSSTLQVDL